MKKVFERDEVRWECKCWWVERLKTARERERELAGEKYEEREFTGSLFVCNAISKSPKRSY